MTDEVDAEGLTSDPAGEFPLSASDSLFLYLVFLHRFREAALEEALKPLEINLTQQRVLTALARNGVSSMGQVAAIAGVERTTLTRTADSLVAAGHIARTEAPNDRRQVLVTLTPQGAERQRRSMALVFGVNRKIIGDLTEPEQRQMTRRVRRMIENLADEKHTELGLLTYGRELRRNPQGS